MHVPIFVTFLAVATVLRAQEKTVSSPTATPDSSEQPNTAAGLRQLLGAMLEAAKSDDLPKLAALVKNTEVPDCAAWLHSMFRSDHADSWMGLCDQKFRGPDEKSFMEHLVELARQDGQFLIRSVNHDPEPGKGMEWGMLQSLQKPLDIYFAGWKTLENPEGELIGYFMFMDGGFRWDSRYPFVKIRIANLNLAPAKLVTKVDPVYPAEAADQHISETVRVYFHIGADGVVYNAHAISGDRLSENASLRKAEEDAVIQWRFTPATVDGKPAESNAITADVVFAP
jgi:Gram-negative bacterial TonB protein C-terminal